MGFDAVKRRADLETYMAGVTSKEKGATFSRNPLFYLVELAGVEPASEIPTSSVLHA